MHAYSFGRRHRGTCTSLFLGMFVCVLACVNTQRHMYIEICTYQLTHKHIKCIITYLYMYICNMHIYIYIHMSFCVCVCASTHVQVIGIHVRAAKRVHCVHMLTYIYIYIYIYTYASLNVYAFKYLNMFCLLTQTSVYVHKNT